MSKRRYFDCPRCHTGDIEIEYVIERSNRDYKGGVFIDSFSGCNNEDCDVVTQSDLTYSEEQTLLQKMDTPYD